MHTCIATFKCIAMGWKRLCIISLLILLIVTFKIFFNGGKTAQLVNTRPESARQAGDHWLTTSLSSLDLSALKPIDFLQNFRNPCWFQWVGIGQRLQCLPYFYIAGVKKSGTTALFGSLMKHPEVVSTGFKGSNWFSRMRFGILRTVPKLHWLKNRTDAYSTLYYSDMFQTAAKQLRAKTISTITDYHPLVFGDGGPSVLHGNNFWETYHGNEGLTEPRVVNLDYVHKLTPDSKVLLILKDPVDRALSDYSFTFSKILKHGGFNVSLSDFHDRMKRNVEGYTECFKTNSVRRCVYNETLHESLGNVYMQFRLGISPVYVRELLRVFPRDQIMVLLYSEYASRTREVMSAVFRFLKLRSLNSEEMDSVCKRITPNSRSQYPNVGKTMMNKTRLMLQKFFEPFNRELATLMDDSRFLFGHGES